jgi:hypothetical protein
MMEELMTELTALGISPITPVVVEYPTIADRLQALENSRTILKRKFNELVIYTKSLEDRLAKLEVK